jgi:hypothetical protein
MQRLTGPAYRLEIDDRSQAARGVVEDPVVAARSGLKRSIRR